MQGLALLAQAGVAYSVGQWVIIAIVVAGIIGVLYIGLRQAGVVIPAFVVQIFWIVLCVFLCVVAVKLLMGMM